LCCLSFFFWPLCCLSFFFWPLCCLYFFFWPLCCLYFFFWPLCCLYFFFWPLCCLYFFDLRFLITSLVSFQTLLLNICAYYNMYTKQFLELHFNVTPTCLLYYHRPRYTLSFFLFSTEFCLRRFDF
jgi:hypothetical protein